MQDLNEAIRLDPENVAALLSRALTWTAKEDYDRALKDYDEAIRLYPKYAWAYQQRGAWHSTFRKNFDQAIKDFDEAIRLDPKDATTFCRRGHAWLYKQDYD